jgi:hypothetical protein
MTFATIKQLAAELEAGKCQGPQDEAVADRKVVKALATLTAGWTNPAVLEEAEALKFRLRTAWYEHTH